MGLRGKVGILCFYCRVIEKWGYKYSGFFLFFFGGGVREGDGEVVRF